MIPLCGRKPVGIPVHRRHQIKIRFSKTPQKRPATCNLRKYTYTRVIIMIWDFLPKIQLTKAQQSSWTLSKAHSNCTNNKNQAPTKNWVSSHFQWSKSKQLQLFLVERPVHFYQKPTNDGFQHNSLFKQPKWYNYNNVLAHLLKILVSRRL